MISQEHLKYILNYDERTGIFTWNIKPRNSVEVGSVAGSLDDINGYIRIVVGGVRYFAHTLAYLYINGTFIKNIDHINGIKDDNRIINLRVSTISQNCMNRSISKSNTSGVKGVSWKKGRNVWVARICVRGKNIHIGYYKDLKDAEKAMINSRNILHGEFANHG